MRAQNDFLREPPSGCGAFKPGLPGLAALYDALPLAFSPPFGFLPSLRCHAGVLAICNLLVFNEPGVEGFVSKVTLVLDRSHMAQLNGGIYPDLIASRTGTVTE